MRAERQKKPQPDVSKIVLRRALVKRMKEGRDRLGLRTKTHKRWYIKRLKRSGCCLIDKARAKRDDSDEGQDKGDNGAGVDYGGGENGAGEEQDDHNEDCDEGDGKNRRCH